MDKMENKGMNKYKLHGMPAIKLSVPPFLSHSMKGFILCNDRGWCATIAAPSVKGPSIM